MKIYSTLTKTVEEFVPINGMNVNLFVCGPTVYDYPHLGHAKTYIQFDFVVRYLRWRGYDVTYLQNITDIDDKIINRANENGFKWNELSRKFEEIYIEDMKSLGNTSVNKYARATDYISQIVKQVQTLIDKGFAYKTTDGIYFEVAKFKDYGKLSKRTEVKENDSLSRIDEDKEKRGWNDFCLWKNYKEGEPFWETELGKGRPGWHIEDTAITETEFGPQYDIHGGAVDLIFPHHEAEISQMEAVSGKVPLVKYWMHTGFLNINSEKMSKSKENFTTIREALKQYDFRVIRYLFLNTHYRSEIDFSELTLIQAQNSVEKLNIFVNSIDKNFDDSEHTDLINKIKSEVIEALDNDFNAPIAWAAIYEGVRQFNIAGKLGKNVFRFFEELNSIFEVIDFSKLEVPEDILKLAKERTDAKSAKDWAKADELREKIKTLGYLVEDFKNDCKIRKLVLS
ncbi:cysteine--tRNA ligase [Candidatus Shapirobacteria bacterium CG03_land_8_20_14_0_80_35_14]|uniref:Cysteine--tRNA ligase n=1 Tax=Candidatus Shapirobacteria bacterium CG03_land_8_20_14_0_80_35_14 TaxID=1974878 RepID=A0A2M7BPY3_9BACT|nr:MAG: cysteine--tRNA ligase [Candidatus Shapirobacteria bacterium CG03_land_8_20_14_0_80_35_14]